MAKKEAGRRRTSRQPRARGERRAKKTRAGGGKRPAPPAEAAVATSQPGDQTPRGPTIVGVGMSAGGLEACIQMLEVLPERPGFAIVVIQHLAPHQRSSLPTLLAQHSSVPVVEARNEMTVETDHVYVIPPDVVIDLAEGGLRLRPRPSEPIQHPIDFFLRSLAAAQGDRAIAVILSGTGSDGAAGARAIKEGGGTVLVQQPETAKYDGMPRAALETGVVDLALPPGEIARSLVDLAESRDVPAALVPAGDLQISDGQLEELVELLQKTSGVDFAHYKQPTIRRRILRRMAMRGMPEVGRYIALLRKHPEEARSLYRDMLIHVTRFFREPESFDALATVVLPKILERQRPDTPARIWVAGCATGEEAYSVAMTVFECAGDGAAQLNAQIFATDVSEAAVEFARQGLYPARVAEDVPADKLRRFFTKADAGYRISRMIRDHCVFARQDLTRDPPFSKLDLIVCRNVLIYMDAALQRKVLPIFHYALRPDGYLMLGQAETAGASEHLFSIVDRKQKIYCKNPLEPAAMMPATYALPRPARPGLPPGPELTGGARAVQNEANRILLDRYGPPGVLVNEDLEVLQFRGHTGPYLESPPGDASMSLLKLAREGLLHGLRSALQAARKTRKPARKEGLRVRSNREWTEVDLEVVPLTGVARPHFLVVFNKPGRAPARATPSPGRRAGKDGRRTERLEEELAATREYLQSIIQEIEAANEELQSANEEILSSNEELQSTNEELDTAKEELQSTNEELNTLNEELHARNEELTRVNGDLINLLGSVDIAIAIVSTDLRIRRFTPMAEQVLNLIATDVGRPITQVKPNIDCPDLGDRILDVIDKVTPFEREVQDAEGRWYSLRIRPYKGVENRIDGAVVAVVDIDMAKRQEQDVADGRRAREYAEAIVETVREPLLALDSSLRVRTANPAFCDMFQVARSEIEGRYLHELGNGQWGTGQLRRLLDTVLRDQHGLEGFEADEEFPVIGRRTMLFNARLVNDAAGKGDPLILVAFQDITRNRV